MSPATWVRVCRYRSCMAAGSRASISAASRSAWAAWRSPSAWMTLARRSRSASAWRAMARIMLSFRSMCLISTLATLMPQLSVCASRICCTSRLSFSRSASISSSSCLPSTARRVVWANWLVATRKFSTWMMAFSGSTTRKNTMALTLTETLSREITSCEGTSMVTTRRSTLTICWMPGMTITRPGPLTFQNRPSRKMTPRSYSRRILIEEKTKRTRTATKGRKPTCRSNMG